MPWWLIRSSWRRNRGFRGRCRRDRPPHWRTAVDRVRSRLRNCGPLHPQSAPCLHAGRTFHPRAHGAQSCAAERGARRPPVSNGRRWAVSTVDITPLGGADSLPRKHASACGPSLPLMVPLPAPHNPWVAHPGVEARNGCIGIWDVPGGDWSITFRSTIWAGSAVRLCHLPSEPSETPRASPWAIRESYEDSGETS